VRSPWSLVVRFIVVTAVEAAHRWDPEERGCASSAVFVIFGLWVVVRRSHPLAFFAGKQILPPLASETMVEQVNKIRLS
jgi:hypothetical protein